MRGALALAAAGALVLAACGSSSSKAAPTTAATDTTAAPTTAADSTTAAPTTVAGPSKSPISIGVLAADTGFGSETYGNAPKVAQAWATWVNANGGINGHPVKIVSKDGKGDPAASQAGANDLVADSSVVYSILELGSTEGAAAPILDTAGLVFGGGGFSLDVWGKLTHGFNPGSATIPGVLAQPLAAQLTGSKNFSQLVCAEDPACAQAEPLLKGGTEKLGMKYLGQIKIAGSAPDYTAECVKNINDGATFIQLNTVAAVQTRAMTDCLAQGYTGYFGMPGGPSTADALAVKGLQAAGTMWAFPWWSTQEPVLTFQKAMKDGGLKDLEWSNTVATTTWASLEMFRKAVGTTLSDAPTRDEVLKGFNTIKDEDLGGLLAGKVTYEAGKPGSGPACIWLYTYKDGKFATLSDSGASGNSASGDLKSSCSAAG